MARALDHSRPTMPEFDWRELPATRAQLRYLASLSNVEVHELGHWTRGNAAAAIDRLVADAKRADRT